MSEKQILNNRILHISVKISSWLAVFTVFLLPYERIPSIDLMGLTVRGSHICGVLLLLAVLPLIASQHKRFLEPIRVSLFIFLTIYAISAICAPQTATALKSFTFVAFTTAVACAFSFVTFDESQSKKYYTALITTTIIVLAVGFYQYFGDVLGLPISLTGLREAYSKNVFGFPRIQGTALEPLYFANFLLIPFFALAARIVFRDGKISESKFEAVMLVVIATQIFLTVSRGAIIGLVVTSISLGLLAIYRRVKKKYLFFIASIIVSALIALGMTAIESPFNTSSVPAEKAENKQARIIQQTTNLDSQSDRSRNRNLAINAYKQSPVIGIGPGGFDSFARTAYPQYNNESNPSIIVNNLPLEILAESGLAGVISLLAFLIMLAIAGLKLALKENGDRAIWAIGLMAYFAATAIQYQTFSTLYIMHIWVAIGLLMAIVLQDKLKEGGSGKESKKIKAKA